jgi:hypothetical protein
MYMDRLHLVGQIVTLVDWVQTGIDVDATTESRQVILNIYTQNIYNTFTIPKIKWRGTEVGAMRCKRQTTDPLPFEQPHIHIHNTHPP